MEKTKCDATITTVIGSFVYLWIEPQVVVESQATNTYYWLKAKPQHAPAYVVGTAQKLNLNPPCDPFHTNLLDELLRIEIRDHLKTYPERLARSSTFSESDLVNLPLFASKLKAPTNAMSFYLRTNLSAATREVLDAYPGLGSDPRLLQTLIRQSAS